MTKRKHFKQDYYARKCVRGNDEIMVAGWDSETKGLGGELLSMQYAAPQLFESKVNVQDKQDMVDKFIDHVIQYPAPIVWYCHNIQYDLRYIIKRLTDRGFEIELAMRTQTDVYECRIINPETGKKIILRDSYAIFNSTLKELAASFCPELPKGDLDFDKETYDPTNQRHVDYAIRDVEILRVGLPRLFALLHKHFGVNPNATFASTSLKAWQLTIPENVFYNASDYGPQEEFIRQAYYGGLVFLTDTGTHKGAKTYDINSSYPAAMCEYGVPYGRVVSSTDYVTAKMGIYRVRVRAPENLRVAILLARDKRGNMRQFSGEFDTVVTNRELVFAANHGYEILEIYEGLVWEDIIFPFNEHIEHCKAIRFGFPPVIDENGKKKMSPEEYLAKFMQNSLYGKFGSRRTRRRMLNAASCKQEDLIGAIPWGEDGEWFVKEELDEEMRCMPHWAVFITAHARLRLLQTVYEIGAENVLYGDTDSITVKAGFGENIDVGAEYGQWKLEKEWREFRAIAPKVYAGIIKGQKKKQVFEDGEQTTEPDKYSGAAKGLPRKNLNDTHWKSLLESGHAQAQALSLPSLRVAMKKGVKPATLLVRKSSTLENSSNFIELPNGEVRTKIAA